MTDARRVPALALGGLVALAVAIGIGRFVYTPILPLMVKDVGMTQGEAGLLASANFAGYLAGALLAATPVVAGPRRRWLLAGLTVRALRAHLLRSLGRTGQSRVAYATAIGLSEDPAVREFLAGETPGMTSEACPTVGRRAT